MKLFTTNMKQALPLLLMATIPFQAVCQDHNIDSLKSLLSKTSDVQYVDVLFELARA